MKLAPLLATACVAWSLPCDAAELSLQPVPLGGGAYAVVADLGPPTYENGGVNANLGFIVTPEGVVVIDTGPSVRAARALHDAIRQVTNAPVRWVVNTNSQPNRWHGNAYFRDLGVPIVAHSHAVKLMRESGGMQLEASRTLLKDKAEGTVIAVPAEEFTGERRIVLGGTDIRLMHFGAAHTRGDIAVWLPGPGILFTGDIVYTERLLAVIPAGRSADWLGTFDALLRLAPKTLVPGHGSPTTPARAVSDTRDYLAFLRGSVKAKLDAGASVEEAVDQLDQSQFSRMANFRDLSRRNAFQVYLELELE